MPGVLAEGFHEACDLLSRGFPVPKSQNHANEQARGQVHCYLGHLLGRGECLTNGKNV